MWAVLAVTLQNRVNNAAPLAPPRSSCGGSSTMGCHVVPLANVVGLVVAAWGALLFGVFAKTPVVEEVGAIVATLATCQLGPNRRRGCANRCDRT